MDPKVQRFLLSVPWELVKATCERICLTSCAQEMEELKVRFCVQVRGAGGGFQKSKKGCGILSGDHPSYREQETG